MTTEEARARIKQQAAELRQQIDDKAKRQAEWDATPPAYLSTSAGQWRVIAHGMPLCSDKPTAAEAMAAAKAQRVIVAPVFWDGDRTRWAPMESTAT